MDVLSIDCSKNHFLAIYTEQMNLYETSMFYILHYEPFIIQWRTIDEMKEHFWKIVCLEIGDDHQFIIEETHVPYPFYYEVIDHFYPNQHSINASSYHQHDINIQQVKLFGFEAKDKKMICQIVLQFEQHHIHFKAGPVVDFNKGNGIFNNETISQDFILFD